MAIGELSCFCPFDSNDLNLPFVFVRSCSLSFFCERRYAVAVALDYHELCVTESFCLSSAPCFKTDERPVVIGFRRCCIESFEGASLPEMNFRRPFFCVTRKGT